MPYCPNGHSELEGRFCPQCGAPLVESPPSAQGDSVRVRSDDLKQTQTVHVSPTFVMPSAAPTAQPALVVCPKCGRRNTETDVFDCLGPCGGKKLCLRHFDEEYDVCVDCAASMRTTEGKREAAEAAPSLVVCPICGRRNQERDVFDCRGPCGRKNLCPRHFDQEHNLCSECAEAVRREAMEREQRERARREAEQAKRRRPELTLILAPGVELELVRVPAGEFTMGSAVTMSASGREKPQHRVYLDEFLMGKYPVTVDQYRAFVGATGHQGDDDALGGPGDHPVVRVSWQDARAFCGWASEVTGRVVRLPTEAEWEKAARGTDGRRYPWGNAEPDTNRCNFDGNVGGTSKVGLYSPEGDSPYGCADMAGNVGEWVLDWYDEDYYGRSPSSNPPGPSSGGGRVLRGGSFGRNARLVCVAIRFWFVPEVRFDHIGFRICASPI